jgi:hypothetical protein
MTTSFPRYHPTASRGLFDLLQQNISGRTRLSAGRWNTKIASAIRTQEVIENIKEGSRKGSKSRVLRQPD